jgi:hypothetical protein
MGQWLEAAGFHIGDPVLVRCEDGKLIISLDNARAGMIEAEKAFMEKETRKPHEKFLNFSCILSWKKLCLHLRS